MRAKTLKKNYKHYLLLALTLLLLITLPAPVMKLVRRITVAASRKIWSEASAVSRGEANFKEQLQGLEVENQFLRSELLRQGAILDQQVVFDLLQEDLERYATLNASLRESETSTLLESLSKALPAQVIYRDPANWSSSLWINVGTAANQKLGRIVIAKDSPVVVGRSLVGVVDVVEKESARVRLITDSGLNPSVRAARGTDQDLLLKERLLLLHRTLCQREDLFTHTKQQQTILQLLEALIDRCAVKVKGVRLAKGILQGSGAPLWRLSGYRLKGIGFNYDYPDEEGPARDLRSGNSTEGHGLLSATQAAPIVQEGDLLVTTGMDGIFPRGLHVAEVVKVDALQEGGYAYSLEALPTAGELHHLTDLFVLPPLPQINSLQRSL